MPPDTVVVPRNVFAAVSSRIPLPALTMPFCTLSLEITPVSRASIAAPVPRTTRNCRFSLALPRSMAFWNSTVPSASAEPSLNAAPAAPWMKLPPVSPHIAVAPLPPKFT
jgi:hypothetical protein